MTIMVEGRVRRRRRRPLEGEKGTGRPAFYQFGTFRKL